MAANRYPWVCAALCCDATSARLSREHNDANVIAFGERLIGVEVAKEALRAFLQTPFAGDRHIARVQQLGAPPPVPGRSCLSTLSTNPTSGDNPRHDTTQYSGLLPPQPRPPRSGPAPPHHQLNTPPAQPNPTHTPPDPLHPPPHPN